MKKNRIEFRGIVLSKISNNKQQCQFIISTGSDGGVGGGRDGGNESKYLILYIENVVYVRQKILWYVVYNNKDANYYHHGALDTKYD